MAFIFLDIDTQYDFMDPEGALYVPGAEDLVPNFRHLYELAGMHSVPVIATLDTHTEDDPEFDEYGFPPHCVRGTLGQEKLAETTLDDRIVVTREGAGTIDKLPAQLVIEKVAFSVFTNPHAESLILERVPRLAGIAAADVQYVVFGVATDYCVKAAALGLIERGAPVYVVEDAIAPVEAASGEEALQEMVSAGARFVRTHRVAELLQE